MANAVALDYHVSAALLTELSQTGVNAYLWYNSYTSSGATTPWTNIVLNGVAQTTAVTGGPERTIPPPTPPTGR